MTTQQAPTSRYGYLARSTVSGAHIRPVEGRIATGALRRFGLSANEQPDSALAAYDDDDLVIGALAIKPLTANVTTVWLAVAPPCRRLRVATDLFDTLIVGYAGQSRHGFLFRQVSDSPIAAAFVASLRLPVLRLARDETLVTLKQSSHALRPHGPLIPGSMAPIAQPL
jgi:hypothetical protein